MINTVSSAPGITLSATSPITHLCPFKEETDHGTITVTWLTLNGTIELHSLRAYFKSFANTTVSHEELTDTIRRELGRLPSIKALDVTTRWDTAGMEVLCSTSPTLAALP